MSRTALVVTTDPQKLERYQSTVAGLVDVAWGVDSFPQAKEVLVTRRVDVLVTDVRLREFNGLHLALWCSTRMPAVRVVVTGTADSLLEADAMAAGAWYVSGCDLQAIAAAVLQALARGDGPTRRVPRKRIEGEVTVRIGEMSGRLLDVGYGGFCVETPVDVGPDATTTFVMDVPSYALRAAGRWAWTTPAGPAGKYRCGAALHQEDAEFSRRWRTLVDSIGGPGTAPMS